jgi:phospholipid transport system substrate-binding protein
MAGIAAASLASAPSSAAAPDAARTFINDLGKETVSILEGQQVSATKASRLEDLFRRGFDFETIGRFVLGRHWTTASPQQRKDFLDAFTDFVTRSYARRLADETVNGFSIENVRDLGEGDVMVSTAIRRPSGPPLDYAWRVRETPNGMRIVDIVVEGVSLLITQRSDFTSVAQRDGLDSLIKTLRQRAG